MSGYSNLTLTNIFGKLDLYQLDDNLIYPRIYSPQNIAAINNFDVLRNNFDLINSGNSLTQNLSFVLNNQIKSDNKNTKEYSNFFTPVFQNNTILINQNQLVDELEIPTDGNYQFINKDIDKATSVNHDLDKISIYPNNSFALMKTLTNNNIYLKKGQYKLQMNLDNLLDSNNLLDNNSFESGFWQKEVGNCNKQSSNSNITMNLSNDSTDGSKSLELLADKDVACTVSLPIKDFNKNNDYVLTLDYKIVSGDKAGFCIWDGKRCLKSETIENGHGNWTQHQVIIKPASDSNYLSIFLYAPAKNNQPSQVRYDNLSIQKTKIAIIDQNLLRKKEEKTLDSVNIKNAIKINPTQYKIDFSSRGTSLLVFQESYHPGWRAFIQENKSPEGFWQNLQRFLGLWPEQEITPDNHIVANGYANGWWIDKTGNYQVIIEFWPQRWFYFGLIISTATLIGIIICSIILKRKRISPNDFN